MASAGPSSPALALDPSLLDLLPPEVDGLPVRPVPETIEDVQGDAVLAANVEAIAFAVVVDETTGEIASVTLSRLRPGVFDDGFWRDWRDSYDAGACAQAGGMVGNAETTIEDRTVFIGTCEGGARTYHTVIDEAVVVSVTAAGDERRLGQRVMEALDTR